MNKKPPKILAIETATSSCSVAVRVSGEIVCSIQEGSNIHSRVLLQEIDQLLAKAKMSVQQLDAVAVGRGPGSFTGLRIGIGVAQGLAFGANCPMIGVSSLAALANTIEQETRILACIDARMGEIYWQLFERSSQGLLELTPAVVTQPERIESAKEIDQIVGNAWQVYADQWPDTISALTIDAPLQTPRADEVLRLAEQKYAQGERLAPEEFEPVYVRNKIAKKSGE